MKKLLSLLLVAAMLLPVLAGCGGGDKTPSNDGGSAADTSNTASSKQPEALIIRATGDPRSFNPTMDGDDNLYPIAQNMFHRLVCLDASKSPVPDAAESWDISEDACTITWHLKKELKWHDGEALDAEDVKYTFDYIKEHPTCYFSSSMDIVDSIEIVDPYTVAFHFSRPDMSFVARVGWYGTFILPEHIFNNGQTWEENPASQKPIGSGPYKFESFSQGSAITLVANEDYAYGVPAIKKLIFSIIPDDATAVQAFLNGEVDFLEMVPAAYVDQFLSDSSIRMILDEFPSPWRILFNVTNEKLSDVAVRKAIAMCIDRDDISNKVSGGVMPGEYSVYPSVVEWCSNTTDTFPKLDIAGASKVLEDAGYTKDADGYYVRGIEWEVFEGMEDMANLVIANCKEAGIELKLNLSEFNAWDAKVNTEGNFMMESQGGFMGPDPATLFQCCGTGQGRNYSLWSNAEFDELCQQAAAEPDQAKRADLYKQAQKIVAEELPMVNVLGFASYKACNAKLKDMPSDGAGKWGWADYSHAYFAD